MRITITLLMIFSCMILFQPIAADAKEKREWESYSVEKNLEIMERWAKKWIHITNKDVGYDLSLTNRLRSAQLWVDIQKLKQIPQCRPTQKDKVVHPPQPKRDWTGYERGEKNK